MTTILLLDGEPWVADIVRRGLLADGITVDTVVRPVEAFALIAARDYGCVVTELVTPEMRGAPLIDKLVADKPGLPVIVLTSRDQAPAAAAVHRAIYDVCTKPVDLPQLSLAIRRAVERRTLAAEVDRLRRIVEQIGTGAEDPTAMTLEQVERRHILRVITTHRGNKAAAAAVLGVDRKTLYRKLLRYGSET